MSAKSEAEKALQHLVGILGVAEPLEGLSRFMARGAAEYALDQVRQIQEVKRMRRATTAGPEPEEPLTVEAPEEAF